MHHGITCDLTLPATVGPLDEVTGSTIYRNVQEGLTNVAPHSRARSVRVALGGGREITNGRHAETLIEAWFRSGPRPMPMRPPSPQPHEPNQEARR